MLGDMPGFDRTGPQKGVEGSPNLIRPGGLGVNPPARLVQVRPRSSTIIINDKNE
jgi:hypothetical protein